MDPVSSSRVPRPPRPLRQGEKGAAGKEHSLHGRGQTPGAYRKGGTDPLADPGSHCTMATAILEPKSGRPTLGSTHPLFLTLASKKLLAPLTPSVETSISERRASTCSPLSSCSSPAAALRKIRRNCSREKSMECQGERDRDQASLATPGPSTASLEQRRYAHGMGARGLSSPRPCSAPAQALRHSLSGPWFAHLYNGMLGDPPPALLGYGKTAQSTLSCHQETWPQFTSYLCFHCPPNRFTLNSID